MYDQVPLPKSLRTSIRNRASCAHSPVHSAGVSLYKGKELNNQKEDDFNISVLLYSFFKLHHTYASTPCRQVNECVIMRE